jgi:Na+/H+ antiporter NhaD/arsenite permease-like protein
MFIFWIISVSYLLILFFIIDKYYFDKIRSDIKKEIEIKGEEFKFSGIYNVLFLFGIIGCVFITGPPFLREVLMLLITGISYKSTPSDIHKMNKFSFKPILEVAILFFGIFVTMVPALELLSSGSKSLSLNTPSHYFWLSGVFTSILDSAPAYLNMITASMATFDLSAGVLNDVLKFIVDYKDFIVAISVSSVFFGAMTYIGNGPNLMVKSIAENKGVEVPGFLNYIFRYSIPILLPFFFILWLLFFR